MADEAVLKAKIDATGAESGATAFGRAIDRMQNSWVIVAAKAFAAEQAFSRVWALGSKGADFEESLERLNVQMNGFHSTAQLMITDLKNISNGQLSNASAVQLASRALMQGMNPDQIRIFTQAADLLGDVMGTDLKGGFDTILQGLQTGRTQMLANIGVYIDLEKEVKELAVATNRTTEQITKQEKAAIGANAVIKQLGGTLDKFASNIPSDADKMKALEARFDDLSLAASRFGKSMVLSTIEIGSSINDKVMDKLRDLGNWFDEFVGMKDALKLAVPDFMLAASELPEGRTKQEVLGRTIVADTQGNLARKAEEDAKRKKAPPPPLDPELKAIRLAGDTERNLARFESALDDLARASDVVFKKIDDDYRLNLKTAQQTADAKLAREVHVMEVTRQIWGDELTLENESYKKRVRLGFQTTQEKFSNEEKHKTRVEELQRKMADSEMAQDRRVLVAELESDQLTAKLETDKGQRVQAYLNADFQMREDARQRNFQAEQEYLQGEIDLAKFQYGSQEEQFGLEREKLKEQMAFKLRLKREEIDRLMLLQQNGAISDDELASHGDPTMDKNMRLGLLKQGFVQDSMLAEQQRGDVFAGWKRGMQQYVQDTKSGFGLAQDMARRTAQMMEQSFQKYFFDAMDGKITSLKDVLSSFLEFTKQILSQLASQLIVKGLLTSLTSAGGSAVGELSGGAGDVGGFALRGHANGGISAFESGGIASRPMLRWAGGGMNLIGEGKYNEAYVPLPDGRTIPVTMKMPGQMMSTVSVPVKIEIYNQNSGQTEVQTQSQQGSDGSQTIKIFVREAVKDSIAKGEFDQSMGSRYGAKPQPVRR